MNRIKMTVILLCTLLTISLLISCDSVVTTIPTFAGDTNTLNAPVGGDSLTTTSTPVTTIDINQSSANDASVVTTVVSVPTTTQIITTTATPTPGIKLYNAIVNGSNVNPGTKGTFTVTLTNDSSSDENVSIAFAQPSNPRAGYTYIGDDATNWITITPAVIDLQAGNVGTAVVTLDIPTTAILPTGNLEFWLTYSWSPGGFFNYTLNQRWLLTR
jgi:uncharacterized protein YceK